MQHGVCTQAVLVEGSVCKQIIVSVQDSVWHMQPSLNVYSAKFISLQRLANEQLFVCLIVCLFLLRILQSDWLE